MKSNKKNLKGTEKKKTSDPNNVFEWKILI